MQNATSVSTALMTVTQKAECNCSCRQTRLEGPPSPSKSNVNTDTQPPQVPSHQLLERDDPISSTDMNQSACFEGLETVQDGEYQVYDELLSQGDLQELPDLTCSPLTHSSPSSPELSEQVACLGMTQDETFFSSAYGQNDMIDELRGIPFNRMAPSFDFKLPYAGFTEYFHDITSVEDSWTSDLYSFEDLTTSLQMPMVCSPEDGQEGTCVLPMYPDRQGLKHDTLRSKKRRLTSDPPSAVSKLKHSEFKATRRYSESDGDAKTQFLGCPFYKRHPREHQECSKYVLKRLKDVKQHLKRHHAPPEFYCARCYLVFAGAEARDVHARRATCRVRAAPPPPSPPSPQLSSSSSSSSSSSPLSRAASGPVVPAATMHKLLQYGARGKSTEEQWFDLWDALFAGVPRPPSAYVGSRGAEAVSLLRDLWGARQDDLLARAGADGAGVRAVMEEMLNRLEAEA